MSPQYLSPGVYVEEVDKGSKPIEGVGTAVAAFVGFAERGPVNQPTFVANWSQFANVFGGFLPGAYLAHAVYGYFNNGGGSCYVSRLPGAEGEEAAEMRTQAALPSRTQPSIDTFVVTALEGGVPSGELRVEITQPSGEDIPEDRFNLIVRKGSQEEVFENLTLKKGKGVRNALEVVNRESQLIRIAEKATDLSAAEKTPAAGTYALVPVKAPVTMVAQITPTEIIGDVTARSGVAGFELADDVTMVCVPDLMALYQADKISKEGVKAVQQAVLDHCTNMKDRFAILDCLPELSPQEVKDWRVNQAGYDSKYGAVYYPWIKVANPLGNGEGIFVPPCGHMAGIYARTDTERGVHKAPANEIVQGALGLEIQITKSEQDSLNPVGVNCIRAFPGRGIRVWGARTISSDASWRYINVRRLFNFVEKSIEVGTQWVVFEPNDMDLWERIKRDITAFLTRVWRDGALFGATASDAFYVKCDEELNPVEVRDAGQVIIEIGMAPVKPAEFVIFRISQWSGGGAVAE
jgi:uncharacterized protein